MTPTVKPSRTLMEELNPAKHDPTNTTRQDLVRSSATIFRAFCFQTR